jgi:hypothetical protein
MYGGWLRTRGAHNGEKSLVPFDDRVRGIRDVSIKLNSFGEQRYRDLTLQAATKYCEG